MAMVLPESQALWREVLERLKERMSQPSFETWITSLALQEATPERVVLSAESAFNRDWILRHYRQELGEAFAALLGQMPEIRVEVSEPRPTGEDSPAAMAEEPEPEPVSRPWTPRTVQGNLNPKYTFDTFVVGQHNRFCHAAALAVAETPAQSYNPFFIYGGVGLGKTHLMQAIGHFVHSHHVGLQVKYVTAEQFTNELIHALGTRDMKPFRDRYRKIDVLIIDDIQFLEGKERTQEEVFHTFNTLHEAGKQIILSSDRPPKHLSRLEDRLRSRFEWGLIADIQAPDLETRTAILQKKAEREKLSVPPEILAYIAETVPNNIRELEGALNKVAAYAMLTRTTLDMATVKSVLGTQVDPARLSLESILESVAAYFHLRPSDLKSPSRAKDVSYARQIGIYVVRDLTESSFPRIGQLFGDRKHTTVLYAYEKVKEALENQPVMAQQIQEIIRRIKSRSV